MSNTLYVTPAQVLAAQLAVELSEEAGEEPDEALKAIANAQVQAGEPSLAAEDRSHDESIRLARSAEEQARLTLTNTTDLDWHAIAVLMRATLTNPRLLSDEALENLAKRVAEGHDPALLASLLQDSELRRSDETKSSVTVESPEISRR